MVEACSCPGGPTTAAVLQRSGHQIDGAVATYLTEVTGNDQVITALLLNIIS
jgi:hypothetical protein